MQMQRGRGNRRKQRIDNAVHVETERGNMVRNLLDEAPPSHKTRPSCPASTGPETNTELLRSSAAQGKACQVRLAGLGHLVCSSPRWGGTRRDLWNSCGDPPPLGACAVVRTCTACIERHCPFVMIHFVCASCGCALWCLISGRG
jgi:hypothetical protein